MLRGLAFALGILTSLASAAQVGQVTRISGSATDVWAQGAGHFLVTFSCEFSGGPGTPCAGVYQTTEKMTDCSNALVFSGTMVITGLDLSVPGPIQGHVAASDDYDHVRHPDGSCSIVQGSFRPDSHSFTGTWDGRGGTISFTPGPDSAGDPHYVAGTFTAERGAPVFPMVVTASIDAVSANATAVIQFRSQDVGTSGSVYVFAVAPATRVISGFAKADPVACVLAQLNAIGQLQQVSTSTLQAYLTGTLSAQGASVSILNNVSTPNVAGATFYVGYGANTTTMIDSGVNRGAVSVPGTAECRPGPPQTGWWWNPAEGGRGFSIEASGNKLFMAAYLYDESGRATWLVSSGPTSLDGSLFTGDLLGCRGGQTLGGAYPGFPQCSSFGSVTLAFSDAMRGTLAWPGGTVPIERMNLVPGGLDAQPQADQPESGWWWNSAESGRGFFIEWQKGFTDLAGYMYDDTGNPIWLITVNAVPNARNVAGSWWQYADGQTLMGTYRPATRVSDNVATVTVVFTGADTGTMTLPGGKQIPITRQRF